MMRRASAPASVREVPSPKAAMADAADARLAPLDGIRAVACVSLVAFHTVLVCTMFHPFNSANDLAFRSSPLFGILTFAAFQVRQLRCDGMTRQVRVRALGAGGGSHGRLVLACESSQVEMMMVLSGFLLGRRQRQLCGTKCREETQGPVATAATVARAVWTYALHRAVRLWPMLLACVALQVRPRALPCSVFSLHGCCIPPA
jgi:peptidoglycan/LPS O-acetylase OafA/YrhL